MRSLRPAAVATVCSLGFVLSFYGPDILACRLYTVDENPAHNNSDTVNQPTTEESSAIPQQPLNPVAARCLFCSDYLHLLGQDIGYVLAAPMHWEEPERQTFFQDTLIVVGAMVLLDGSAKEAALDNQNGTTSRTIANSFEPFGANYSFAVLGGFYLAGAVFDQPGAAGVARDGVAASIIASGMITPFLKVTVGRIRPNHSDGDEFGPFKGGQSFPSGHTTQAFAVASVISEHYNTLWVRSAAYGTASLVGYARIDHNAHFLSDVLAGAMIGTAVGKSVVHFNARTGDRVQVLPIITPGERGLTLQWLF